MPAQRDAAPGALQLHLGQVRVQRHRRGAAGRAEVLRPGRVQYRHPGHRLDGGGGGPAARGAGQRVHRQRRDARRHHRVLPLQRRDGHLRLSQVHRRGAPRRRLVPARAALPVRRLRRQLVHRAPRVRGLLLHLRAVLGDQVLRRHVPPLQAQRQRRRLHLRRVVDARARQHLAVPLFVRPAVGVVRRIDASHIHDAAAVRHPAVPDGA
mmetsp:Transcript_5852/g.18444  ORF Transcript_5852/g.18444 Transcript_5852/m.18444 type:complete len:209 (+) Transcript_5852:2206-2832(+)